MTKLVILGILQRQPLHGYEIKHIIEEAMGDWTNIAFGSIYFALKQLTKEGCVQAQGPEKMASRPARIVYEITQKGKECFLDLLKAVWKKNERQFFGLDVALFFASYMQKADMRMYVKKKLAWTKAAVRYLIRHKEEETADKELPQIAQAIFSHTLYHLKAEYRWLKDLLQIMSE